MKVTLEYRRAYGTKEIIGWNYELQGEHNDNGVIRTKIMLWLKETFGEEQASNWEYYPNWNYIIDNFEDTVKFKYESDAALFNLAWGGEI